MPIPKIIHQTFKSKKLPWLTKWYINRQIKNNPNYSYEFYDDARILEFLNINYDGETVDAYQKLNIGAAKADFFRYAVLYKKGGIYVDIDSRIIGCLDNLIHEDDEAIIANEKNPGLYVQWALVYAPNHPFLARALQYVIKNIKENKFPNDVHQMTGPTVYSKAIYDCLKEDPDVKYRNIGVDYNGNFKFKSVFSKLMYQPGEHWKKQQLIRPVLK